KMSDVAWRMGSMTSAADLVGMTPVPGAGVRGVTRTTTSAPWRSISPSCMQRSKSETAGGSSTRRAIHEAARIGGPALARRADVIGRRAPVDEHLQPPERDAADPREDGARQRLELSERTTHPVESSVRGG